jgi:hypothetical protein
VGERFADNASRHQPCDHPVYVGFADFATKFADSAATIDHLSISDQR